MLKYFICFLVLLMSVFLYKTLFYTSNTSKHESVELNQLAKLSPLTIEDYYSGTKFNLPSERNDIIHLWASWCEPCIEEFPEIIKNFESIKAHSNIYLISLDSTSEDLDRFLKLFPELRIKGIPIIFDKDKSISKYFNVSKLPKTVILEKNTGNFLKTIEGLTNWLDLSATNYNNSSM